MVTVKRRGNTANQPCWKTLFWYAQFQQSLMGNSGEITTLHLLNVIVTQQTNSNKQEKRHTCVKTLPLVALPL